MLCVSLMGFVVNGQQPSSAPAVASPTYSESMPYKPRELFIVTDTTKSQKKDGSDDNKKVAVQEQRPEPMPGNGPAVKDESPITFPVSVFDAHGSLVTGLMKNDFKLFIDGTEATVLSVEHRNEQLNVVLVVDVSPSDEATLDSVKKLALSLTDQFAPPDKITVFKFASELKQLCDLTNDRNITKAAIRRIDEKGVGDGTSLYDITQKLSEQYVPSLSGRTVVLLITDGVDTTSKTGYSTSIVAAEKAGAAIFPIYIDTSANMVNNGRVYLSPDQVKRLGITSVAVPKQLNVPGGGSTKIDYAIGRFYLDDLVFASGGRAIPGKDILSGKTKVSATIADEIRSQYYVTVQPVGSAYIGQRKHLTVRICRPDLVIVTRGSYIVGSPPIKIS
jgi:VWFA-related protein